MMCGGCEIKPWKMEEGVYPSPKWDLKTYQQHVLMHKSHLSVHRCISILDFVRGTMEAEPYILWLCKTFEIDVHERRSSDGYLYLWNISIPTARLLHVHCGFDVNSRLTSRRDESYAEAYLKRPILSEVEFTKPLVWCGAKKTPTTHPNWIYLFLYRSRCARACRALVSRQFHPYGERLPRDLALMLARALWESRVEDGWDMK